MRGLRRTGTDSRHCLDSIIDRLELVDEDPESDSTAVPRPEDQLVRLAGRFPLVARQLRRRHAGRPTLAVDDEYDVQDLLHTLLRAFYDDIRVEPWTPSYAGGASRMDLQPVSNEELEELEELKVNARRAYNEGRRFLD